MFALLLQMSSAAALNNGRVDVRAWGADNGLRDEAYQPVSCTSGPPGRDLASACDAGTQAACEASYVREDNELMAQTILWECSWDHTDSGTGAVTAGCSQLGNGHTFATVDCPTAAPATTAAPTNSVDGPTSTYYRGPHGAIDNHLDITGAGGLPGEGAVDRRTCINTKTTTRSGLLDGNSCYAGATTQAACDALYEEKYRGDHRVPGVAESYNLIGEVHLCQWNSWQTKCEAGEVVTICPEDPYPVQVKLDTDSNDLNVKWCDVARAARTECGALGIDEAGCAANNCCWSPLEAGSAEPWCFHGAAAPAVTSAGSFHERDAGVAQLAISEPKIKEFDLNLAEPGEDSGSEDRRIAAESLDLA